MEDKSEESRMFCNSCGAATGAEALFCSNCGASISISPVARTPSHPTAAVGSTQPSYVGFWMRTLAYIIDYLLYQLAFVLMVIPLGFALGIAMAEDFTLDEIEAAGALFGFAFSMFVQWLWFTVFEASAWQATPGKKMLGLKVVDEQGRRISFGRANGRYWSKIISAVLLCIGFLMVAFTNKKQGLHDKMAETFVVKANVS